jgi:hypothetical protein
MQSITSAGRPVARACAMWSCHSKSAPVARDGEHDELVDRARKCALELEKEAELFDAARELGVVE